MRHGDQVKVIAGPGGLFFGRTGRVFRIEENWKNGKQWIGVTFEDGGKGSDWGVPFWFSPDEVEAMPLKGERREG